jgi:hypothetical protein
LKETLYLSQRHKYDDSEKAKRQKNDSPVPLELSLETTASEPVQLGETQSVPDKSQEESSNMGREASADVDEHDPTLATPVESAHTTPPSKPRRRQEDEESDPFYVDFDEDSDPFILRDDERPRQRSFSEEEGEADAFFKQYVTTVTYPLVTRPSDSITVQAVPNLRAQERQSTPKVRDYRRTRYKTRF